MTIEVLVSVEGGAPFWYAVPGAYDEQSANRVVRNVYGSNVTLMGIRTV